MPRLYKPAAHTATCTLCSEEFVARNIRRTYCYAEACVKTRKRQAATPGAPCSVCGRPSIGKGFCPTHYTEQWKQDNAEKYTHTCVHCGVEFKTWRKVMASCSLLCQRRSAMTGARLASHDIRLTAMRDKGQAIALRPRSAPPPIVVVVKGGWWVSGNCLVCGTAFVSKHTDRACSPDCQRQIALATRARGQVVRRAREAQAFKAPVFRAKVFAGDSFVCQLCFEPMDMSAKVPNSWAPTIDHIVPLANGGMHEPSNVQSAHFLCNSKKGNRAPSLAAALA